ncbi:hypothetical protein LCGC14_2765980 [marine sediment metagenome]|uniref:Uncharacterized protein n=1 Tax=marine sediment metagenome TaxID=412755 RepID=A0A0F8ZJD7_9ZZZZ
MGIVGSLVKGAAVAAASAACPPAAGTILLGVMAHKVAKGITDDNEENAPKHVASFLGSMVGADIDVDD